MFSKRYLAIIGEALRIGKGEDHYNSSARFNPNQETYSNVFLLIVYINA